MTTTTTAARYEFADLPGLMALMAGDEKHDFAAASTLDVLCYFFNKTKGFHYTKRK